MSNLNQLTQSTSPPRKRARPKYVQSPYFPSPKRHRRTSTAKAADSQAMLAEVFARPPWSARSRYFPSPHIELDALLGNPGFLCFYEEFLRAMHELYEAKPILIQEHVSSSPWKVLVAVTLLNKTAGKKSIPVFFEIMERWPTPTALAEAPVGLLCELVRDLGLGQVRTNRLITLSQIYIDQPPLPTVLYPSRGKVTVPSLDGLNTKEVQYPPTPISHIPGCGPYALDSYRIFCGGEGEWKFVRPRDKELVKYLQWKWAIEVYRQWDPLYGPGDTVDLDYIRSMTTSLTQHPISH
ncbi:DNA glycosylase [Trametes meyenii]|nr:DNA glycosylase [Trametes meyenii]